MKQIKIFLNIGIVVFGLALAGAFYSGDFILEAGLISDLVWGKVMLLDLYIGFAIFSLLIIFLERSHFRAALWILCLMCLGNIVALIYLLYRFNRINSLMGSEES